MSEFRHENILGLIGVTYTLTCAPLVVLPFMSNGDLRKFIGDENRVCMYVLSSHYTLCRAH